MSILQFYFRVLKIAFTHSIERADLVGGIFAILGGAYIYFNPELSELLGVGLWLVPITFFLVLFISRLILAPYWIYKKEAQELKTISDRLLDLESSLPRVSFKVARQAQMYRSSPVTDEKIPTYELLQAWFENRPKHPSENSTASHLNAVIHFYSHSTGDHMYEIHGQWAVSTAPDHVGYSGTTPTIDLPPGAMYAKLLIAIKYRSEDDAFVYSDESLRDHIDGRNQNLILHHGTYRVKVVLRGVRIDEEHEFFLTNPGADERLLLEPKGLEY